MNKTTAVIISFGLVGLTLFFGSQFPADQWYENLNRAPWNPPNWAFPLAWSFIYFLIALVGTIILQREETILKVLWFCQLGVNAAWTYLFFGLHETMLSLIDLVLLDALVICLILALLKRGMKCTAVMLAPYLIWILLATSLNLYIVMHN